MAQTRQHSTRLAVGQLSQYSIESECQNPPRTTADSSTTTDACSSTTITYVAPQQDVICSSSNSRCRCSNSRRSRSRRKHDSNSGMSSELTKPVSIQLVSFQRTNNEITVSFDQSLPITQHKSITSCQLVKDSHIVTSSVDIDSSGKPCGTVQVWNLTAGVQQHLIKTLPLKSPVHKAICITDRSEDARPQHFPYLILAGTESGHLIICRLGLTLIGENEYEVTLDEEENKTIQFQLHRPNPLTAVAISSDQRHLVTGCQYLAFDFVRTHHNSSSCGGSKLDRRTRGTVKTWNWALLRASQSNAELVVTCSRTDRQLMSSMTSEREAGFGVTSLALCEDSSLLAVGLSSIAAPESSHSSSSSSSAAAAAVVVCSREKMEPLWITDNLKSSCVHEAVFLRQQHAWSLFIATDTTVEKLYLKEKMALQKTGQTYADKELHCEVVFPKQDDESSSKPFICLSTDGSMLAVTKGQVFAVLDTSSASWLLCVTDGQASANHDARQDVAERFVSVVRR